MAYSLSTSGLFASYIPNPKSIVKTVVYITFLLRRLKTLALSFSLVAFSNPVHSSPNRKKKYLIQN